MSRLARNFFSGRVSRTTLLAGLLMGFTSFISSIVIGICMYPENFDWRKRVMSRAISPHHNPDAYWIPALGVAAGALLMLPFAGYVERRMRAISPHGARFTGVAFAFGILLFLGVALPLPAQLPAGLGRLHEVFARASVVGLLLGVFGCCACAFKDRRPTPDEKRLLRARLAFCWISFPLLLVTFGLVCGIMLLGRKAQMEWAIHAREILRPTMFWQLAFWEWVGLMAVFGFIFVSALWLPEQARSPVPSFTPARRLAGAGRSRQDSRIVGSVKGLNDDGRMDAGEVFP